jgi:hypothetical protein
MVPLRGFQGHLGHRSSLAPSIKTAGSQAFRQFKPADIFPSPPGFARRRNIQ